MTTLRVRLPHGSTPDRPSRRRRIHAPAHGLLLSLGVLLGFILHSSPVAAQATGSVTGQVLNASSGASISQAQVFVVGTEAGGLTRGDGRFLLTNVPIGTQEITVELVGYARQSQTVQVEAGGVVAVDFRMREQAVALDEIVVTGLADESRRREIGTSMNTVDVASLEAQGTAGVEELLRGSGPGVEMLANQGQVGSGGSIKLRGSTSVTQGNEPLIYVDGVRMGTARTPPGAAFDGRNTRSSAFTWNELNPSEIERIEIIKGAAATALYGTEASGGVIQVFTKRGSMGEPEFTASVTSGANFFPVPGDPIASTDDWFTIKNHDQVGRVLRASLAVTGGLPEQDISYRISVSGGDEEGIVPTQFTQNWNGTANFDVGLSDNLRLQVTNSYSHRKTRQVSDGNNRYGYMLNVLRQGKGYWADNLDQSWVLDQEYYNNLETFLTAANVRWTLANFQQTFRVGVHHSEQIADALQPFGWHLNPEGTIAQNEWTNRLISAEYVGTWSTDVTDAIGSSLSVGGQLYDESVKETGATGTGFPGPGNHTVSSAAQRSGEETEIREVTAGAFIQEKLSINENLFITGAVRADGNSAFGEDLGIQFYPKLSVSYVLSDMDSWPRDWWDSFRLRGAYGEAGKAPGAFDAARTWSPISGKAGEPGVSPGNLGDPDLAPERTKEIELGFDSEFFGGRLGGSFTWFNATTTDALFAVQPIPSQGFLSTQLSNVGELESKGIEVSVSAVVYESRNVNWSLGWDLTHKETDVVDMGGAAPFSLSRLAEIREGYPAPAQYGRKVLNPDELADPVFEEDAFLGRTFPNLIQNFRTSLTMGSVSLNAVGEWVQGGHNTFSVGWLNTVRDLWPPCNPVREAEAAGDVSQYTAMQRAQCLGAYTGADMFVEPSDFFKLRSVSLTWRLPDNLLRGLSSGSLSVTGSNLFDITDYPGIDPESHHGGPDSSFREDYYTIPPRRAITAKLTIKF